ncbi:MAG: hypothetical protein O3A63_01245, partial [Proteobacteria bacterium]|nr:hypothetical protein [Pseudomonadota bacterium]
MIEAILSSPQHGATLMPVNNARLSADAGLVGDRHAGSDAIVSLIEAEAIDAFNRNTGLNIIAGDTGRNIVTRG